MSTSVITTKLSIPARRSDWVLRPRLLKRLDEGLKRRLTLISAPAGFGKTTLLASWLHNLGDRKQVAWLSLEEDDNDPVRFLTHLIAALQTIDRTKGQMALPLLETPRVPRLEHVMTLVINDLAALPGTNVIVLDDYHVINHSDLQAAVAFLLDHLPPNSHLVVATREEPMLPLPRLRARWEMVELRLQDLRFTHEETAAFLKRTMGLALTAQAAQALEDRTEGWIAGLQMAALSLRGRGSLCLEIDSLLGGQRDIIDYLAAEVLKQQPEEICAFLRQTAILDRFNSSLCDAVTGRCDSQSILTHLERANLFLIPLDDQRQWYRYHHLFADFLRAELDEAETSALHVRASRWHEEHGATPEAIKHALSARDYEAAVRLIRRGAEEWNRDGKFNTLLGWVNALPEDVVREHSDLLVHKGWIPYLRGEMATGEAYAALAVESQRPDDSRLQRGMLLGFRAHLAINRGEPAEAVKFAEEALTLLGDTDSFYRTVAVSHLGKAQRLVGDRQTAIQTLRQAIALGQRFGHHLITLEALGYLTQMLYQQGQLREAILSCETAAREFVDSQGQPLPVVGMVYIPLGVLYYETNDLDRAHHHLMTGLALCQQMGTVYPTLIGQRTLAKLHYARGRIEEAWETLAAARELAAKSENARRTRLISAVTAELQLRQGHISAAQLTLKDLPAAVGERSEFENLTWARLLLAQGEVEEAGRLLCELEESARRQGRLGSLITIYILRALVEDALNRRQAAIDLLGEAICLAAPEGYRRIFLDENSQLFEILPHCRHLAPGFVDNLIASLGQQQAAETPSVPVEAGRRLHEPLSETQMTILRLVADGLSNRDIASRLTITEGTTKWHLNQIYTKLHVCSRTQAVAQARQLNLL